jgi:hypothetical protein
VGGSEAVFAFFPASQTGPNKDLEYGWWSRETPFNIYLRQQEHSSSPYTKTNGRDGKLDWSEHSVLGEYYSRGVQKSEPGVAKAIKCTLKDERGGQFIDHLCTALPRGVGLN